MEDAGLLEAYATTVLEITLPNGERVSVEPRPIGETVGPFPADHERIHVITAANPRSHRLTEGENADRNRRLERDLRTLGVRSSPAVGRSPDGSWSEDSFALYDAAPTVVLGLTRAHEQNAVFLWTPRERAVLSAEGGRLATHGWWAGHAPG